MYLHFTLSRSWFWCESYFERRDSSIGLVWVLKMRGHFGKEPLTESRKITLTDHWHGAANFVLFPVDPLTTAMQAFILIIGNRLFILHPKIGMVQKQDACPGVYQRKTLFFSCLRLSSVRDLETLGGGKHPPNWLFLSMRGVLHKLKTQDRIICCHQRLKAFY